MLKNKNFLKKFAAIFFGLILFVIIVILGFQIFGTRAADLEPRDVTITDITQNSANIVWTTGVETQAVIEYGTSPTALNFFAPEANRTKEHKVELSLLSPSTTYYFQIRINDKKYDNGGVPWTFTTKGGQSNPILTPNQSPNQPVNQTLTPTPTPIQVLDIEDSESVVNSCDETDCEKIKLKFGKGCTTQDYFRCIKKSKSDSEATESATPTP
jgi:hypothetical protein